MIRVLNPSPWTRSLNPILDPDPWPDWHDWLTWLMIDSVILEMSDNHSLSMMDPRDGKTSEKKVLANQNNEMVHIRQLPSWVMECCVVQCTGEILSSVQNWEKISIYLFVKFCNSGGAQYTALTPQRPISSPQGATALQHSQRHHHSCHYLHNVFHPPRVNRILYFCDFNVLWDGWGVLKLQQSHPQLFLTPCASVFAGFLFDNATNQTFMRG